MNITTLLSIIQIVIFICHLSFLTYLLSKQVKKVKKSQRKQDSAIFAKMFMFLFTISTLMLFIIKDNHLLITFIQKYIQLTKITCKIYSCLNHILFQGFWLSITFFLHSCELELKENCKMINETFKKKMFRNYSIIFLICSMISIILSLLPLDNIISFIFDATIVNNQYCINNNITDVIYDVIFMIFVIYRIINIGKGFRLITKFVHNYQIIKKTIINMIIYLISSHLNLGLDLILAKYYPDLFYYGKFMNFLRFVVVTMLLINKFKKIEDIVENEKRIVLKEISIPQTIINLMNITNKNTRNVEDIIKNSNRNTILLEIIELNEIFKKEKLERRYTEFPKRSYVMNVFRSDGRKTLNEIIRDSKLYKVEEDDYCEYQFGESDNKNVPKKIVTLEEPYKDFYIADLMRDKLFKRQLSYQIEIAFDVNNIV